MKREFSTRFPVFLCIVATSMLAAQTGAPKYDERILFRGLTGVQVGGGYQQWNLTGRGSASQIAAPVGLSIPITPRVLLTIANTPGMAKFDTSKVQGLTDTRMSASYVLPGDRFWLSGGVSLPTGVTKLSSSQLPVAGVIAQTALGYRVPVFGQGLAANLAVAYGYAINRRFVIGVGAAFLYKGSYTPAAISGVEDSYDPGDEVSVNGGFDYTSVSRETRVSGDVTVTNYLADKLNGATFIQSGLRFMVTGNLLRKLGPTTHLLQLRGRLRTQSEIMSVASAEKYKSSQHYEIQYVPSWNVNPWLLLGGSLEGKVYTGDQIPFGGTIYETGKASLFWGGVDVGFVISRAVQITVTARAGSGDVTIENATYSITGAELSAAAKYTF